MPIKSYIVIPHPEALSKLVFELNAINGCQVHPAQNKEVVVLVTDTLSEEEEKQLLHRIEQSQHIAHLSFVSGFE